MFVAHLGVSYMETQYQVKTVFFCVFLTYLAGFVSSVNQHHLLVCYLHDVKDILQVYELSTGKLVMDLPLDVGTVCGVSCKKKHSDFFYKFSSFTTPGGYFVWTRVHLRSRIFNRDLTFNGDAMTILFYIFIEKYIKQVFIYNFEI